MSKEIKMDRKIELSKMVEDIYWDYTVNGEQLLETARTSDPNTFDFKRLFTRAFERINYPRGSAPRVVDLRGRYDRYRAVLLGKPLPDADSTD